MTTTFRVYPEWNGTGGGGGTGNSNSFAQNIGDTIQTSWTVNHGLGTLDIVVEVYQISDGMKIEPDIVHAGLNTVTLGFTDPPGTDQFRVVVVG